MPKLRIPKILWIIVLSLCFLDILLYVINASKHGVTPKTAGMGSLRNRSDEPVRRNMSVDCNPGVPCEYPDEVDLRIIVITFNRAASLKKLLASLDLLEMDGDTASLEIWIDRKEGKGAFEAVNNETLHVARSFKWSRGHKRVHVQKRHVGIYGQWIDTWRPRTDSSELGLFLEDDLSVSPYAYRWLRAAHCKYCSRADIAGYTLQSEGVIKASGGGNIKRPSGQTAFLYKLLGSWGYAPHPKAWTVFQDWYHAKVKNQPGFHPYVSSAARLTSWYKTFEKNNKAHTMWTMWHVHFCDQFNMYTVFNNIGTIVHRQDIFLAQNREEPGLHYGGGKGKNADKLLTNWSIEFINFPDKPVAYGFNGKIE